MKPLVDRYRPTSLSDIQGHNKTIKQVVSWAKNWDGDKAQLFAGDAGVGKTSTARALANDMEWSTMEVNMSDKRTTDDVARVVADIGGSPILAEQQLVILDEIDSIPGRTNTNPLLNVLKDPPCPIILICNEKWQVKKSIVSKCTVHDFKLGTKSIQAKLGKIAKAEGYEIGAATLGDLAQHENLRDAINGLQMAGEYGDVMEDVRQYESSPFSMLDAIRKGHPERLDDMWGETPRSLLRWLDSGLQGRYRGVEALVLQDILARSDKWICRVERTKDYSWWRYNNRLHRAAATIRLDKPWDGYVKYGSPSQTWVPTASGSSAEAELYRKVSGYDTGRFEIGCNFHEFRNIYLPILKELDEEDKYQLAVEYGLEGKELKALDIEQDDFEGWAVHEGEGKEETSVFDW